MNNQSKVIPVFKEQEKDGVYTATLEGVFDNRIRIGEKFIINISSIKKLEDVNKAIQNGIVELYNSFNKRISFEIEYKKNK